MDTPYCDVIGCANHAGWLLAGSSERNQEEFLCNLHMEQLRARHPEHATEFRAIAPLDVRRLVEPAAEEQQIDARDLDIMDIAVVRERDDTTDPLNGKQR